MTESFLNKALNMLKLKVVDRLKALGELEINLTEILEMFETLQKPFCNLDTEYRRFQTLEETGNLILAEDYVIGTRYQRVLSENGHVKNRPSGS